jgi:pimeloyl-ACP methyl ester carboxylesterase
MWIDRSLTPTPQFPLGDSTKICGPSRNDDVAYLDLPQARIWYEQMGAGADIVWLAAGDMPGASWHDYQLPAFDDFRNTTWDARGVGRTTSHTPPPWPIETHSTDCIQLIERRCRAPVFLVGLSMGSLIAQEIALTRPDLVRAAIIMGTCARKTGFIKEWEDAEIAFRRDGATLPREFAVAHYAILMYPAEVLGDDALWAKVRPVVARDYASRDGAALAEQWQACVDYDSLPRLPFCKVPLHVVAFSHDVQTPPSRGKVIADAAPNGHFHLLEGLGHGSAFGHRPEVVNACIRDIVEGYVSDR